MSRIDLVRCAPQAGTEGEPSTCTILDGRRTDTSSMVSGVLEVLSQATTRLGAEHGFPGFWSAAWAQARELAGPIRMAVVGALPGSRYEVVARGEGNVATLAGAVPWVPTDPRLRQALSAAAPRWIDDVLAPGFHPLHALDLWFAQAFPRALLVLPTPGLQDHRGAWILQLPAIDPKDRDNLTLLLSMYALHVGTLAQLLETRLGRARHERELKQIHALTEALGLVDGLEDIERVATHYAQVALGGERAWLRICPPGPSLIGRVIRDRKPICISDIRAWPAEDALTLDPAVRSLIAVPVRVDATVLGALSVGHGDPGAFSPQQVDFLGRIAHTVGAAYVRKLDELALREAKRAAEAASSAKSEFLADMSYAIRTPLSGVVGMADLLATTTLTEEQRDYLDTIRQSSDALLTIVEDVVSFSKNEATHTGLEPTRFVAADVVGEAVGLFTEAARAKGVELEFVAPSEAPIEVVGDPFGVRQVVAHLVSNALKLTDSGKVAVTLGWTHGVSKRTRLEIRVQDTGDDIPPDHLHAMFEPTGAAAANFDDPGGLASSKRLAELMGGSIEVRSEPGRGSTYTLRIPFERSASDSQLPGGSAQKDDSPTLSQLAVLLVDDNPSNVRVASRMLATFGCDVTVACSGWEAIERVNSAAFDVILMDCQMPGMDGFEATRRIRGSEPLGVRIPILAMTADVMSRDQCFAAGMDDFIAKPIILRELEDHLAAWIPASRAIKTIAA